MAYDYNKLKKQYEGLNDEQKQQFQDMNKNDTSGNFQKFMDQYNAEQNQTPTTPEQPKQETPKATYNEKSGYYETPTVQKTENAQVSPDLDQSKFGEAPGQITVQEGTAKDTGKPDYQISTDARLNEMKSNLDQYFATSPRMFSDRDTFNKMFQYNERESDAQKQLLDSYWKRKEDMDRASQYTSGESINNGIKNGQITTDQLNLIKEYDQEAYRKWQQLQEEEIQKRIVNGIVPPLMSDIATQIQEMINNLGIQAQDALDIEGIYNDTMERVGAYQTLTDANNTVKQIEAVNNKITSITSRYAASTGGTVSDALAAARMQKALAPYQQQMQGLQYQYQDYSNLYSQKSATALQAANVRALQANENQRIWNQKCQALGFATSAMSYRTPEQTKQLDLQYQQAMNDMSLLQQSRQNDLSLYNKYATAKLENKLANELTDLSVSDPEQLRANLNNVLSSYYTQYGDLIQRSQSQVVDDVLKYAKDNNVSVAQALTENFIKQLQNKPEYQAKIKASYLTNNKSGYSKITLNGKDYLLKDGELVDMDFLDDGNAEISVQEGLASFLAGKSDGQTGGWCGTFVNDYLQSLGLKRLVKDDLQDKKDLKNIEKDELQIGDVAIFDYSWNKNSSAVSENSRKYGHVAIVTDVDWANNKITLAESNFNGDKKITTTRTISMDDRNLYGFYSPKGEVGANMMEKGYSESRIGAYDKYLTNGTLPSDAKLKSMGGLEKFESEVAAYKADRGITTQYSQQAIDQVTSLRKEFDNLDNVQAYRDMETYYNKIIASADGTAAGDLSLIFAYMKMLDPRSVVREGEFATAQNSAGLPQKVVNAYNNALYGTRLSDVQRKEFTDMAKKYLADAAKIYNQELARYQGYVTYGGDVNSIGQYATIPGVYNTNGFQSFGGSYTGGYGGGAVSDIDSLVNSRANM